MMRGWKEVRRRNPRVQGSMYQKAEVEHDNMARAYPEREVHERMDDEDINITMESPLKSMSDTAEEVAGNKERGNPSFEAQLGIAVEDSREQSK